MKQIFEKQICPLVKRLFTFILRIVLVLFIVLGLLITAIQLPWVQNKLVDTISSKLSQIIKTEVSVGNVSIDFLTRLHIHDVLIRDYKRDTLIYVGSIANKHLLDYSTDKSLRFIGQKLTLSDVKFYLDNTVQDSVFNLTKTFRKSPPNSQDTINKKLKAQNSKPQIDFLRLGSLHLNNVRFRLKDKYNYQTISFHIDALNLDARKFKFSDSIWKVGKLKIYKPSVSIVHHPAPYTPKSYKPEYFNLPFQLHLDFLQLEQAKLRIYNETTSPKPANQLNFSDLDVRNIHLNAENVELRKHSIQGDVLHLRALEKSGLAIKELRTRFFMNSFKTEAKKLTFKTNYSMFKGYLRFNYRHMREYLRFAEWVRVTGDMNQSNLSLKDLAFFTPTLKNWEHIDVKFTTLGKGRMNDFTLTNLTSSLNNDKIKVNGQLQIMDMFSGKGLNTIAQFRKFSFNKGDIEFIFQKKGLPEEITRLGTMTYDGEFRGNPTKFLLNGKLSTSKGLAILKNTQFDFTQSKNPQYKGYVDVEDVRLNEFLQGGSPINHLSAEIYADGQGFEVKNLNTLVKGVVSSVTINNQRYTNFQIDGRLMDKEFNGEIKSLDPSLRFIANGKVSMQEEIPRLELHVNAENIDLQKLGYTKQKLHLYANVFGTGRGKNIDELLGTMSVKDMYVVDRQKESTMYGYSNLTIEKDIFEESGNKYIQVNSDELTASLIGQYRVSDIPKLLKDYFISYLAINKNQENVRSYENTFFSLNVQVKNLRNYALVLHPPLKNMKEGRLTAKFNGSVNKMSMAGEFHQVEYLSFKFPKLTIDGLTSNTDFKMNLNIDSVYFQNRLGITPFKAQMMQDDGGLNLSMELLKRTDEKFVDFHCNIKNDGDNFLFHVKPFTSYFGKKVWSIHPDNKVVLNLKDRFLATENLEFYKDKQTIKFENNAADVSKIKVQFDEVRLEELISGFLPILKTFKGNLNGTVEIADLIANPKPIANLSIGNMLWDNEKIGDLILTSELKDQVVRSFLALSGEAYRLRSEVLYNAKEGVDSLYSSHVLERCKPNILNKILNTLVYDMDGNLHGEFKIYGPLDALNANGRIVLDSLMTGIHTIFTKYTARNQIIDIVPGKIVFNQFKFNDEEGNEGRANGFIQYNNLKKFDLFIDASSDKLLCMNSTSTKNSTIYGKVYADATVKFRGTIGDRVALMAKGRNLANSILSINLETAQNTGKYGFYEFKVKDSADNFNQNQVVSRSRKLGGVNFEFDFDITRDGRLFIIMDPSIDDRIECNGQGRIVLKMTPETDIDLKGSYEIFSGTYLFTYQNLVQRLFYLNKGGLMTFVGDPRASIIDASATFTTRASAQELISAYFGNTDNTRIISAAKSTVKTNIILNLRNRIAKPDISYELKVDQNNPEVRSAFESIESTTRNNEAELNKQVIGLLVFRRFFPPTFTGFSRNQNSNNAVTSDLQNTAFDVVTGKLSGYVTDWMQNTFKGMNFGLSYKNYNQLNQTDNLSDTRNELKIAVSQRLLNDRLVFNLGGNYDFGRGQFNNSNTNTAFFGGDMDIEYLLSPQGNVRAKFYSTLSNDPLNSVYINKTGVGILIQKDFDEFNQLFKKMILK